MKIVKLSPAGYAESLGPMAGGGGGGQTMRCRPLSNKHRRIV